MFLIPRRQIWTQQPQGAVEIDWSNPLTRGLTYATADGAGGAVSSITSLGSVPKIADRWGKGDYFDGSSQKTAVDPLAGRSLDSTVVILHKSTVLPPNGPAYCHVLASTTGSTSADYFGWILMLGNGTGFPLFRVYQSIYGAQDAACDATTGALNDGKPHVTIATVFGKAGGAMTLDVDGKTVASSTHPKGLYSRTNNLAIGKARHDFWGGFEGSIGAVFVFDRALSAKERSSLSANPWQIFKRPDSRIFVPVSVGGGSTQTLTPPLHTNSQSFYSHAVSQSSAPQSLTASLFASSSTIFVPTVQASKALSAGLFSNANTPYSPTVTATKTLATSFYSNAQVFYPPAVSVGAVSISPPLYSSTPTFYAHVLNQVGGPQNVVVPLFNNTRTFYSPLLSPGAVSVAPSLYANAPTFYGLTVTTSKALTASLFSNASELYEPLVTLAGGPLVIAPSLFSNTASFFTHTVASGLVQLYPVRFDSPSVFYAPVVSTGSFSGSISDEDITRIVQAVLAALNATTIPVDTRKMNGSAVIGTGLVGDDWRGVGVQPQ